MLTLTLTDPKASQSLKLHLGNSGTANTVRKDSNEHRLATENHTWIRPKFCAAIETHGGCQITTLK